MIKFSDQFTSESIYLNFTFRWQMRKENLVRVRRGNQPVCHVIRIGKNVNPIKIMLIKIKRLRLSLNQKQVADRIRFCTGETPYISRFGYRDKMSIIPPLIFHAITGLLIIDQIGFITRFFIFFDVN